MSEDAVQALRASLAADDDLAAAFAAAQTPEDVERIAASAGLSIDARALANDAELSDAELASVSGGYTFPATDWIYCDNPWTNVYCTLKC
jgi:predicted ribosomally synthesized peptide with nif11-like leader